MYGQKKDHFIDRQEISITRLIQVCINKLVRVNRKVLICFYCRCAFLDFGRGSFLIVYIDSTAYTTDCFVSELNVNT